MALDQTSPATHPISTQPPHSHWILRLLANRRSRAALLYLALLLILAIVMWQNWDRRQAHVLFATIEMPGTLFSMLFLAIGFCLGLLTPIILRHRRNNSRAT